MITLKEEYRLSDATDASAFPPRGWAKEFAKRALDLTAALALLTLTFPLILLAMALVKATSRGPALYSQVRVGRRGKLFHIYKIRSMRQDAESISGATWCKPGDSRITRVGLWLRKTHVDELPQLWNVLRGDMSMIGPRPERPEFVVQLESAIAHYNARLLMRPGITGFAQIQLPPDTDLESVKLKLAYDLHYVRHADFLFDVRIYFGTAMKVAGAAFASIRSWLGFADQEAVTYEYRSLDAVPRRRPAPLPTPTPAVETPEPATAR